MNKKKAEELRREIGRAERQLHKDKYKAHQQMKEVNKMIREIQKLIKKKQKEQTLKSKASKREYERLYYDRTKAKKIAKVKAYQEKKKNLLLINN